MTEGVVTSSGAPLSWRRLAACAGAFVAIALLVYRPALEGPFLSDDWEVVRGNPYVHDPSPEHLREILTPRGAPSFLAQNYAPLHLLAHSAAWQAFGEDSRGHHVFNVVLHGLVSTLLVALLLGSGVAGPGAVLGGALFLLHPANVEAVAWISQLKTVLAALLALGAALLLFARRPVLATAAFGLALLAKATALFVLPAAAVAALLRRDRRAAPALAVWTLVAPGYAAVEIGVFRDMAATEAGALPFGETVRQAVALAGRYAVMAFTGYGVGAFQEPPPPNAWSSPFCVAGVFVLGALALRTLGAWQRRAMEAAWWIAALVAFVPVAQFLPFVHPFADRYLYFILPGLIGGTLLAFSSLPSLSRDQAAAAALALAVAFGVLANQRAHLWADDDALRREAARLHPAGSTAALLRAQEAAARGDEEAAVRELEHVRALGRTSFLLLVNDPRLAPLHGNERFQEILDDLAGRTIVRLAPQTPPNQLQQRTLALAHLVRGEYALADEAFLRARRLGGPLDALLDQERAILHDVVGQRGQP